MKMRYKLHLCKKEKEFFIRQIAELENLFLNPKSLGYSKATAEKAQRLINRYKEKARATEAEIKEFEALIDSIPDEETREIAKRYFINLESCEEIGSDRYLDRTTVYRKLKRYFDI